jgi:hypothetical protein
MQAQETRVAAEAKYPKTAACLCGALTVTVAVAPVRVHACTCLDCQRLSGSALSCTAFFPAQSATVSGASSTWRRIADSGRWTQSHFCPTCGSRVFTRMEAFPDLIGVAVGCFADPAFEKPATLYWTARRHDWLPTPEGVEPVERQ